jgi:hypothetical protein
MLTELDDLLTHQTFETHDRVFIDDPRWTERFIIEAHDPDGAVQLHTGLGIYPNTNYMDGFACVAANGEQRNIRAGRTMDQDRWRLHTGPLKFDIVEPMRSWRLRCDDAGYGFSFDLTFTRRTQPVQMAPDVVERDGFLVVHYTHFVQSGRYEGWIEVDGVRHDAAGWTGERDRSWGVRPASARVRNGFHTWLPMQWDDLSIWLTTREGPTGERMTLSGAISPVAENGAEPGPPVAVADFSHDLDIELVGHHRVLRGGTLRVVGADGSAHDIAVRHHGPMLSVYGGGYGGPDAQGTPKGDGFLNGERWSTDPESFKQVPHSILEHICRFDRADGHSGHGCFELCVGRYEPKGFPAVE